MNFFFLDTFFWWAQAQARLRQNEMNICVTFQGLAKIIFFAAVFADKPCRHSQGRCVSVRLWARVCVCVCVRERVVWVCACVNEWCVWESEWAERQRVKEVVVVFLGGGSMMLDKSHDNLAWRQNNRAPPFSNQQGDAIPISLEWTNSIVGGQEVQLYLKD